MANARGKAIDNTHLSLDQAEKRGFLHRDYIAHCFRWSHVAKFLMQGHRYKTARIFDIGCGKELPLARLMYSSRMTHTTGSYTGVDVNKLEQPDSIPQGTAKFKLYLYGKTDILTLPIQQYNVIVCFEVIEHVEPLHAFKILRAIHDRLSPDGDAFISTPNYDVRMGAADNHVNEMQYDAVEAMLAATGLQVNNVYGTFASQRDLKPVLSREELEIFERLKAYYDSNVLATFLAPLYAYQSRNCLWHVTRSQSDGTRLETLGGPEVPYSSSDRWYRDWQQMIKATKKFEKEDA
jgi:2-polyprenyl-3-methyl-5-hydroxy-6-metoxy-1,4-benzoquinol methylase